MKTQKNTKYVYIISFITYGSEMPQDYIDSLYTLADAKRIKQQLKACGHSHITIHKALR